MDGDLTMCDILGLDSVSVFKLSRSRPQNCLRWCQFIRVWACSSVWLHICRVSRILRICHKMIQSGTTDTHGPSDQWSSGGRTRHMTNHDRQFTHHQILGTKSDLRVQNRGIQIYYRQGWVANRKFLFWRKFYFQYTALQSSIWGLEGRNTEDKRMGVGRVMMDRSDRMVKSGSQYPPRVKNNRNINHHGSRGVNRLGYFQRHRPRKPPQPPPPPKIINRKRRPPIPPPPPPPRIQYKRRQGVTKVLSPPFKPYKPPPKKKVSPIPKKHYKPPPPPPPHPPTLSPPSPTYQYQYLPPAQPTPYQVRMSSISPLAIDNRTAFITG